MTLQNASADSVSGRDLRAARVVYGVRTVALAKELGVCGERVRQIERSSKPNQRDVDRYCSGLQALVGRDGR